jgi:hypothetical protein
LPLTAASVARQVPPCRTTVYNVEMIILRKRVTDEAALLLAAKAVAAKAVSAGGSGSYLAG